MRNRQFIAWLSKKILILLSVAIVGGAATAYAAVPNVPTLFYPANGANVGGTMISFNWNPVDNVTYYWLQVSNGLNQSVGNWTNYAYSPFPDDGTDR